MSNKIVANNDIKSENVFLIGSDGTKIGVTPLHTAIEMAEEQNLEVIMIATGKEYPVARIENRNKYLYDQKQKEKIARKNSKSLEMKELRLSPNIAENDLKTKENSARKFLTVGHDVKFTLICKGRESARISEIAQILDKVAVDLSDCSIVKMHTKIDGRNATIVLKTNKNS